MLVRRLTAPLLHLACPAAMSVSVVRAVVRPLTVSAILAAPSEPYYNRAGKLVDPSAPKRPLSAYMHFFMEDSKREKAANPDLAITEVAKKVASNWASLAVDAKAVFETRAAADSDRYAEAMRSYVKPDLPAQKALRKKRDPAAPKLAMSPFFLFLNDYRASIKAENPTMSVSEVAKEGSRRYRELSADEKAVYERRFNEDKIRFENEMIKYNAEKEAAALALKAEVAAVKRAAREERAKLAAEKKEKERAAKEKAKAKAQAAKEKERAAKEKAKEKERAAKEKEREKERAAREKEREKERAAREKAKAQAAKEKAKAQAKKAKRDD